MMSRHCLVQIVVPCSAMLVAGICVAQLGFEEGPWDGTATVDPIDTTNAVAIYACWDSVSHLLPDWWDDIWDTLEQHSVPTYFSEVSFNRHGFYADSFYGRTEDSAFTSQYNPHGTLGGGYDFTWDILTKADSLINFAEYDNDDDGVVDMALLMILRASGSSIPALLISGGTFPTNDTSVLGDTIVVRSSNGMAIFALSRSHGVGVTMHEYGHQLGLPDYYNFRNPVKGNALGSFEPMNAAGFHWRESPFNPWFRSDYPGGRGAFHWLEPVQITSSLFNQPIRDITTGEVYELVSDLVSVPADTGQRFLVSNHQRKSFWEYYWPAKGLMIWHVFDNANRSLRDSRRKIVDLEVPHGLWDWGFYPPDTIYPDTAYILSPNPLYGLDSLDVAAVTWPPEYGGLGSATCVYRAGIDSIFDAFSNPSSDEYNIDLLGDPVSIQDIASHLAVRNIYLDTEDTTVMRADLIVNRVESDVATATAENNARRWVLGRDGETMHLVYVSKGHIYYTTTDSNKVWLPAIPIGQGSYPSLGLDMSGEPAVV